MLKLAFISVFCFIVMTSLSQGRPQLNLDDRRKPEPEFIPIVRSTLDIDDDGSYAFGYEGADETSRSETGKIIHISENETSIAVTGEYRYVDPKTNIEYHVTYKADHNGFVPTIKEIPRS